MITPLDSLGMRPAPPATQQHQLVWAIGLCDRVIAEASARGVRVAVAVVDAGGDPIQVDRMDGAAVASADVALATAATAARFGLESGAVADTFGAAAPQLAALAPSPFLAVPGGHPVRVDGRLVGGLGVGGDDPALCHDLAAKALLG